MPKKVKNTFASIPSIRAPFAMMRPGYTPSREPFEMMMETLSMVSDIHSSRSDAAVGLRDSPDLRGQLGRSLREELIEFLDWDAGLLAERPDRRRIAAGEEPVAHEAHDLPMLFRERVDSVLARDLAGDLVVPLIRLLEEAFGVEVAIVIGGRRGDGCHTVSSCRGAAVGMGGGPGRRCFPRIDMRAPTPGISCPGS